jgi:hypothetical protein
MMTSTSLSIRPDYWLGFQITQDDIEFIYNYLLEVETPQTPNELIQALVQNRILQEKAVISNQIKSGGSIYLPKDEHKVGQTLSFPTRNWQEGTITSIRPGSNPEHAPFNVIEVEFEDGQVHKYASSLESHLLNQPISIDENDPNLKTETVLLNFGDDLKTRLSEELESNPDLVRIAGRWFPRALLVDVNEGHLNLAEAVLDMAGGGPLTTASLLEQVDLPTDVNSKLTEFSFNLALQEDGRFDEVGPSGEVLWFLRRLEPSYVQNPPIFLRFNSQPVNFPLIQPVLQLLEGQVDDDLESATKTVREPSGEISVSLIYPHWRSGTLPLSRRISRFFPSAYESPRVQFSFIDANSGEIFSGWVVRSSGYVSGLENWYQSVGAIPGSIIHLKHSKKPGEVIIWADKRKNREWVRTLIFGSDGGMVFAMLKQQISTTFDERMATYISDPSMLDQSWEGSTRNRQPLEQIVRTLMSELSKLNPQGHVHAQELYAAVNLIRRCPPAPIIEILVSQPWASYLGDLYFRLSEDT